MSEELASLHVVLKAMGLDETTRGVQELERVLKATGLTAEQLTSDLGKATQAASQLSAGNQALLGMFRDGSATTARYATDAERLGMQLAAVNQQYRTGAIDAQSYFRAVNDLSGKLASIERTSLPKLDVGGMMGSSKAPTLPGAALDVSLASVEHAAAVHKIDLDINAAKETQIAIQRDLSAENERQNTLKLQGVSLTRQLESAEDAHNRRLSQYNLLLKENIISQETFNRAVATSERAMRMQSAGGGKGGGQMAFQAAYGIQDFATVVAMGGGVGRGLLSAQNNLSQMLMVSTALNPVLAATLGTVSALAAIGIGAWWESYSSGANKAKTATDAVKDSVDRLNAAMAQRERDVSSAMSAKRLGERGSSDDIFNSIQDRTDANEDRRGVLDRNRDQEKRLRDAILNDPVLKREAATAAVNAQLGAAFTGGPKMGSDESSALGKQVMRDFMNKQLYESEGLKDIIKNRRTIQSEIARDEKAIAELTKAQKRAIEGERLIRDAERKREQRDDARRAGESALSMLERNRRAGQIANGTGSAEGFSAADDLESFFGSLSGADLTKDQKSAMLDEFVGNQKSGIDRQITDLKRQNRPRMEASFQSFSGFGQSLQLSLLKPQDEAKIQREKQIALAEQSKMNLDAIAAAAKKGFPMVMAP